MAIKNVKEAMTVLGIPFDLAYAVGNSKSIQDAQRNLDILKDSVKRKRKRLMKKYHPDVVGKSGEEKAKLVNEAADFLLKQKLEIIKPAPIVFSRRVVVSYSFYGYGYSTTTSISGVNVTVFS